MLTRRSLVQVQLAPYLLNYCGRVIKVYANDNKTLEKPATNRVVAHLCHTSTLYSTVPLSTSQQTNRVTAHANLKNGA